MPGDPQWTRVSDTLISALMEDGLHDRAWAVDRFGCSMPMSKPSEKLARVSEATHLARAIPDEGRGEALGDGGARDGARSSPAASRGAPRRRR